MGERLAVDQMRPSALAVRTAAAALADGGVVIMPTDSVYGIGCAATPNNPAHERVFALKRRDRSQTLPLLVADARALDACAADVPAWAKGLAARWWPGALTLVVYASSRLPAAYVAGNGTVALRVPNSPLVRRLAAELGPLAVTSANLHGNAAAVSGADIDPRLAAAADLTLDAGVAPVGVASTIVDATGEAVRILREGAIPAADIFVTVGA